MPEAVASNSIPASKVQPDLLHITKDFKEIGQMFASLAESACLAFEADHLPDHFSVGMDCLFRHIMTRFEEANKALYEGYEFIRHEQELLRAALIQANDLEKKIEENKDGWGKHYQREDRRDVFKQLSKRLARTISDIRKEHERESVAEHGRIELEITAMADHYACTIQDEMMEDRTDLLEAGSFLPWAELKIRDELAALPRKENRTLEEVQSARSVATMLRDRFIIDAYNDGCSLADLSIALGWNQPSVQRTIDRLTGKDQEGRKAG